MSRTVFIESMLILIGSLLLGILVSITGTKEKQHYVRAITYIDGYQQREKIVRMYGPYYQGAVLDSAVIDARTELGDSCLIFIIPEK